MTIRAGIPPSIYDGFSVGAAVSLHRRYAPENELVLFEQLAWQLKRPAAVVDEFRHSLDLMDFAQQTPERPPFELGPDAQISYSLVDSKLGSWALSGARSAVLAAFGARDILKDLELILAKSRIDQLHIKSLAKRV